MAPKASQKKRPASDAGSAPKKAKITQSDKTSKSAAQKQSKPRSAPREREEEAKKRKKPITQGGGEEDEDASMDEGSFSDEDQEDQGAEGNDVDMDDGDAQGAAPEKKRLSKAEKQALHAAQPHRTTLLPSHPLLHDTLLPLWETARRADLSKEERKKAITELWEAVKGRVIEVSRGHKGGRVLQTVCPVCSNFELR